MNALERRGWHIDKGLNPAYIVPLVAAILTGLAWAGSINSEQVDQNRRIGTIEKRVDESITTNREDLKEINRKLDRLIERGK
jgi:hypothetical protein